MKEKHPNSDRRGRPFFGKRRNKPEPEPTPRIQLPSLPCCICQQMIQDMATALAYGPNQDPAHFDCVLKSLQEAEPLAPQERLTYLGSGIFGVICPSQETKTGFQIQRKIQVENKDNPPQWRKDLKNIVKK